MDVTVCCVYRYAISVPCFPGQAHLLAAYIDDLSTILTCTLMDPFHDVKKVLSVWSSDLYGIMYKMLKPTTFCPQSRPGRYTIPLYMK